MTRKRILVPDAAGDPALQLASVPGLVLVDWVESLRRTAALPEEELREVFLEAARVFEEHEILGDNLHAHELRVARLTGTPLSIVRECDRMISAKLRDVWRTVRLAAPAGCAGLEDEPLAGAVWRRVGDVFAVNAAGNSPAVHASWLEALALGYRVVVRPSNRDPLTAFRLVTALRLAGLPNEHVVMAPGGHDIADVLVERSDCAMVYGGQAVVDKYRSRSDVLTQGPGRSKLVVAKDSDRRSGFAIALEGVLYHAGTACTSTTGILVEDDSPGFAAELAEALGQVEVAPPWHEEAVLPALPGDGAERLVSAVLNAADPDSVLLRPRVERIGTEGMAVVTPAVIKLSSPQDPLLGYEVPFPCAWVAPFDRRRPEVLRDSLVVSLHTSDAALVRRVSALATVANVYCGKPTSWSHPDVPHDAFLGEFIMRSKGFALDEEMRTCAGAGAAAQRGEHKARARCS
ncbi:MAG: aldehyde dehydrogenase family protein [Segniliparus sp.]